MPKSPFLWGSGDGCSLVAIYEMCEQGGGDVLSPEHEETIEVADWLLVNDDVVLEDYTERIFPTRRTSDLDERLWDEAERRVEHQRRFFTCDDLEAEMHQDGGLEMEEYCVSFSHRAG